MTRFEMNGYVWHVERVPPDDPMLIDRTGRLTVATTDPDTMRIYLADNISGDFAKRVIAHELGHAAIFSYDLLGEIKRICRPEYQVEAEEFMCNFLADYGEQIFSMTYKILGDAALRRVPMHLERLIS